MPPRLPSLLAAPPRAEGLLWLFNATLFDGTGSSSRAGAGVLVQDGVSRAWAMRPTPCRMRP